MALRDILNRPAMRGPVATKPRVLIESPFAGDRRVNRAYLLECLAHSLMLGEAPFASHLFYTQFLDDDVPEERELGIECGLVWGAAAQLTAVYVDLGVSRGMQLGIDRAKREGRPVVERRVRL